MARVAEHFASVRVAMSWPSDGQPRYVARSLTGVAITPSTLYHPSGGKPGTVWYVYDRAYCHAIVAEFRRNTSRGWKWVGVVRRVPIMVTPRQQAEELAAELNAA